MNGEVHHELDGLGTDPADERIAHELGLEARCVAQGTGFGAGISRSTVGAEAILSVGMVFLDIVPPPSVGVENARLGSSRGVHMIHHGVSRSQHGRRIGPNGTHLIHGNCGVLGGGELGRIWPDLAGVVPRHLPPLGFGAPPGAPPQGIDNPRERGNHG